MSERRRFSICIPCFNHGKYIGRTIESVLAQDVDDIEVIVADNASTDNSRDVVRGFEDPRVRLMENQYNIGFAPNLQRVTSFAKGEFINLLSSDDIMNPGALRTYSDLIDRYEASSAGLVLMSEAYQIDGDDQRTQYITRYTKSLEPQRVAIPDEQTIAARPLVESLDGREAFAACMRSFTTAGVFCTVVYSRSLWESVGGYNSTQLMNPDMHFIMKVLRRGPSVLFVNRPLYSYRRHEGGQAAQQAAARVLKLQVDMYSYLMQYNDEWLDGTGVAREDMRRVFVDRDCVKQALIALSDGRWTDASRLLAFAWATYPSVVVRERKAWGLGMLLAGGPLGVGAARVARRVMGRRGLARLEGR